jgi:TolB-like protein/Flp pilus assembly protein TadD
MPKLLDFGLAKLTGQGEQPATSMVTAAPTRSATLTAHGVILGTLHYMAPEQLEGKEVGPATDLFAFGCVLYEMVTGRRPFAGDNAASLITAILEREPEPIVSQQPLTPPALDRFVGKCLAKEPGARWQTAADAANELRGISAGQHPGESPVSPAAGKTGRFGRPVTAGIRAVPLLVSFGVLTVAALAAGLFFTLRPSQPLLVSFGVLAVAALAAGLFFTLRPSPPASGIASLAVLPLEDLSGDPSQKVVVDGIHDELTAVLSSIGALQVKPRRAALRYAGKSATEAARGLGVASIVDGSVRMSGDTVKVTLSLLDGGDERVLWTGSYQAVLGDVLKLESQLALEVARELRAVVSPAERERLSRARAIDPEAYRLYRKGNRLAAELTPAAFDEALACFRGAIAREPAYAAPHVAIARTYMERGGWWGRKGSKDKERADARRAIEKAIELDPSLAESHMVLGAVRTREWDWKGADEAFRRGLSLGPVETNSRVQYAAYLSAMGRLEESIAFGRETIARDPFEPLAYNELSFAFWLAGRHAEMGQVLEKSLELDPDSHQTLTGAAILYASSDREKAVRLLGSRPTPTRTPGGLLRSARPWAIGLEP